MSEGDAGCIKLMNERWLRSFISIAACRWCTSFERTWVREETFFDQAGVWQDRSSNPASAFELEHFDRHLVSFPPPFFYLRKLLSSWGLSICIFFPTVENTISGLFFFILLFLSLFLSLSLSLFSNGSKCSDDQDPFY